MTPNEVTATKTNWWKKYRRHFLPIAVPLVLLLIFILQKDNEAHPSVVFQERYEIRLERVEVGNDFVFFKKTWLDSIVETVWTEIKRGYAIIKYLLSPPTGTPVTSIRTGGRALNHFEKEAICFWFSCYDKKLGKWADFSSDDYSDAERIFAPSIWAVENSKGVSKWGTRTLSETKGGKEVFGIVYDNFDPTCPFYFFNFHNRAGDGAWMKVENPHARKSASPEELSAIDTLPAQKKIGDFTVTLRTFHDDRSDFEPKFSISRDGIDQTFDYCFQSWIADAWGNGAASASNNKPIIHAPYWKIDCTFFEHGTAAFPEKRLWKVGKFARPSPNTFQPLAANWSDGDEAVEVWALLGEGRHFFSGRRWLRSEPLPSSDQSHHGNTSGLWLSYTSEYAPDENGISANVYECWTRVPALIATTKTDAGVTALKKWNANAPQRAPTHFFLKPPEAGAVSSNKKNAPLETINRWLLPLDWPEAVTEKEITLGIPVRRDVTFYVSPAEVKRALRLRLEEKAERAGVFAHPY